MSCFLWPRHETLNLVLPVFAQYGRFLTVDVMLSVSAQLRSLRDMDNKINYESWLIVAKDNLKWTDTCVRVFWDMLRSAVLQIGGLSDPKENVVDFEYVVLFLCLHAEDAVLSRPRSPRGSYDDIWPSEAGLMSAQATSSSSSSSVSSPSASPSRAHSPSSPKTRMGKSDVPPTSPSSTVTAASSTVSGGAPDSPKSPHGSSSSPRSARARVHNQMSRQVQSSTRYLHMLRSRLVVMLRCISSALECGDDDGLARSPRFFHDASGARDDSNDRRGGDYVLSRRAFDKMELVLSGGTSKTTCQALLSALHPAWIAVDADMDTTVDTSAAGDGVGSSQEMRVSSSLTVINDGEGGSVPLGTALEWLESNLGLNEAVNPSLALSSGSVGSPKGSECEASGGDPMGLSDPHVLSATAPSSSSVMATEGMFHGTDTGAGAGCSLAPAGLGAGPSPRPSRPQLVTTQFVVDDNVQGPGCPVVVDAVVNSTLIHNMRLVGDGRADCAGDREMEGRVMSERLRQAWTEEAVDAADRGAWGPPERLRRLVVSGCLRSSVYQLAPFSSAHIVGCIDCTIVIGAVAGTIVVSGCDRLTLVATCGKMVVHNSVDCRVSIATLAPSTLTGECRGLVFSPLCTTYIQLAGHMVGANLRELVMDGASEAIECDGTRQDGTNNGASANFWAVMYDMDTCLDRIAPQGSPSGYAIDAAGGDGNVPLPAEHVAVVCDPSEFTGVVVPIPTMHAALSTSPVRLPSTYLAQYRHRKQICENIQDKIRSRFAQVSGSDEKASGHNGSADELSDAVGDLLADRFMEWVVSTGKAQSLLDLVTLDTMSSYHS